MPGRASIHLRPGRTYRRDIFEQGLARLGYEIVANHVPDPRPGDAIVLWNRTRTWEDVAARYEANGADVIIAENGYFQPFADKQFALSLFRHNGAGITPNPGYARFEIPIEPWRTGGDHILVLPQRGIGSPGVAMPTGWQSSTLNWLNRVTKRPLRLRRHPGIHPGRPLEEDLANAWAVVTWGSGAALRALASGTPVFYTMPKWIGAGCAQLTGAATVEVPNRGDREETLARVSWAQWAGEDIASGEALAVLLSCRESLSTSRHPTRAPS